MTALFLGAFIIGALGSFHCVGMCGPIALSLPLVNTGRKSKTVSILLYNSGRVVTYSFFGALFGIMGRTFAWFGYQQRLSISLGALILLFLLLPKKSRVFEKTNILIHFFYKVRTRLGKLFQNRNYKSVFFIGILNGLLPCGLVYMAGAGAVAAASIIHSSLFMAAFGLGTFPMMISVGFFGNSISMAARKLKQPILI
jgi:hypothetical protein